VCFVLCHMCTMTHKRTKTHAAVTVKTIGVHQELCSCATRLCASWWHARHEFVVWVSCCLICALWCGHVQRDLTCAHATPCILVSSEFTSSTATLSNILQHINTHCNALQRTATNSWFLVSSEFTSSTATLCNTLQHIDTHCNTLQRTAIALQHYNTLQHTATHCYTLQHINFSHLRREGISGKNESWFEHYILITKLLLPQVDGAHEFSLLETKTCGCLNHPFAPARNLVVEL